MASASPRVALGIASLVLAGLVAASCGGSDSAVNSGVGGAAAAAGSGGNAPTTCTGGIAIGADEPCYTGPEATLDVGVCAGGKHVCGPDGSFGPCEGEVTPTVEACNGHDDDCNGFIDETCPCEAGTTQDCYSGQPSTEGNGPCVAGQQQCDGGSWGPCEGEVLPSAEGCNGVDDDCDGTVDDGNPEGGAPCQTGIPGVCALGLEQCAGGALGCSALKMAVPELCDGLDNDCDGEVDEDNPGGGQQCFTGDPGVCGVGVNTCVGAQFVCLASVLPSPEQCNGLDDDCDGSEDENNPGGGQPCDTGLLGACANGTTTCSAGMVSCAGMVLPMNEICNGLDDDCDGIPDDGNPGGVACNTGLLGVCSAGLTACNNGNVTCVQQVQSSPDVCGDNLDNDCDGTADEGCCQGGTSVVQIPFSQTAGWTPNGCCVEPNYKVANNQGDTLSAVFTDPTPAGSVITNVTVKAGIEHACNAQANAMEFKLNAVSIGQWGSANGPDCACGNLAVGNASYVAPNGSYVKGGSNTVSILHNAPGNCHEAVTTVPGNPAGTAFRVEITYACN